MQWSIANSSLDSFLIDVAVKTTIILAVAWLLSFLLSLFRTSAASRHAVWGLATAGVFALPLMAVLLPTWHVSVPWDTALSASDDALTAMSVPRSLLAAQIQLEQTPIEAATEILLASSAALPADEVVVADKEPVSRPMPNAVRVPS